jgi:hypothetical protein
MLGLNKMDNDVAGHAAAIAYFTSLLPFELHNHFPQFLAVHLTTLLT